MKRQLSKLVTARKNYQAKIDEVTEEIYDKVEFDFSISYIDSEGWVIEDEGQNLAGLENCFAVIEEKGVLSFEDFLNKSI